MHASLFRFLITPSGRERERREQWSAALFTQSSSFHFKGIAKFPICALVLSMNHKSSYYVVFHFFTQDCCAFRCSVHTER